VIRALTITSKQRDGFPTGHGDYCAACAEVVTRQSRREYGAPLVMAGVHIYRLPDGTTEWHQWLDRDAIVCAGAGCVQQDRRSA
jgi:hypothetical protein